jgi:hypothetical protein
MGWFRRHLNWTAFLTALIWYIISGVSINLLQEEGAWLLVWLPCFVVSFLIYGWILQQKRRTLWWLFILFVPFGWVVFIGLENRSQVIDIVDSKVVTKPKDKSD